MVVPMGRLMAGERPSRPRRCMRRSLRGVADTGIGGGKGRPPRHCCRRRLRRPHRRRCPDGGHCRVLPVRLAVTAGVARAPRFCRDVCARVATGGPILPGGVCRPDSDGGGGCSGGGAVVTPVERRGGGGAARPVGPLPRVAVPRVWGAQAAGAQAQGGGPVALLDALGAPPLCRGPLPVRHQGPQGDCRARRDAQPDAGADARPKVVHAAGAGGQARLPRPR